MTPSLIYLLGAYPVWSETFLRQDLAYLLEAGLPISPVALFSGDTRREPAWPEVPVLQAQASAPTGSGQPRRWWCVPTHLRHHLSLWSHRRCRSALTAFAGAHGATHIHAEFADLPALLAAAVARDLGLSYSVGVHARDVHQPKFHLPSLLGRACFVTACNTAAYQAVQVACPDLGTRLHLIPHGVDLRLWPFRERLGSPHADLRLFYAGRFVEKKGIDTLLRAVAILAHRGQPVALAVAGSGPLEPELRALTRDLGIAAAVTWLGVLPHDGVRRGLAGSDGLAVPSRVSRDGDRDGVPNIVLEAMALGVPVVGTTAGGLGEVLDARSAALVAPDDAEGLAAALCQIAANEPVVEARRREARGRIERDYDAARQASARAALFGAVRC